MTHLDKLTEMRQELIDGIKQFFLDHKLDQVFLEDKISSVQPLENTYDDFPVYETIIFNKITGDGFVEGAYGGTMDWAEWGLDDLDVPTLAYILDKLEEGKYTETDPDEDEVDEDVEPF